MGVLPHSALALEDASQAAFTVDDLIRMSTHTVDVKQNGFAFSMHSAIAVNGLIRENSIAGADTVENAMQGEIVSYAVINKAFTKFQDGTNQTYSLVLNSHTNAAGFSRTDDAFCKSGLKGLKAAPRSNTYRAGISRDTTIIPGVQAKDWNGWVEKQLAKAADLKKASSDPALTNAIATERNKGGGWLDRAFAHIGDWISSNSDTLLDLGF
jgi:hypothetical protein